MTKRGVIVSRIYKAFCLAPFAPFAYYANMNNKVCPKGLGVLALVLLAFNCRADTNPFNSSSQGQQSTYTPAPVFRSNAALRNEGTGFDVGVYGGLTPFQNGDIDVSSPSAPGTTIEGNTKDEVGGVAGFKIGYTWASFDALMGRSASTDDTPSWIMPALYYDFFWTGVDYKATDASFGSGEYLKADMNLATFALEPTLKFRVGRFHPYVGFGVGGTYVKADNGSITEPGVGSVNLNGSADTFCLSLEGIVGTEFFLNQHWALTAEYKYLYLNNVSFDSGAVPAGAVPLNYHSDGLGFQLFTAGIKFYF